MTSFVYDFKDIASRMKGELKAAPELDTRFFCARCHGSGRCYEITWHDIPMYQRCPDCDGTGRIIE